MSHRSLNYYWPSYVKTAGIFRNGPRLSWCHYWRRECETAVFWNGRTFRMPPGRRGLADIVVEMWGGEVYTSGGFYEPKAGDVVLDLGANVGAFSLWVAQKSRQTRVFAVEPSVENCEVLSQNLSGWPHQISVLPWAIGGQEGTGVVVDGGARSVDHRVENVLSPSPGAPSVEVVTLERLIAHTGADHVDLLKMDVEGAEFDVFDTASADTLKRCRRISLEYHDNIRPGTLAMLRRRLLEAHTIVSIDQSAEGYGILRAVLRPAIN